MQSIYCYSGGNITISNNKWWRGWDKNRFDRPSIILPNGMKCNARFWAACVSLKIVTPDDWRM